MTKFIKVSILYILIFLPSFIYCQQSAVYVEWNDVNPNGIIEISNGTLKKISISEGVGKVKGNFFSFANSKRNCRIMLEITDANLNAGSNPTIVHIKTQKKPFSFFLRDIDKKYPVYIPDYNVVVTTSDDERSFQDIAKTITNQNLQTNLTRINNEPEESFKSASLQTRNQAVPTMLGLSRDMRKFEMRDNITNPESEMHVIKPINAGSGLNYSNFHNVEYAYIMGRGQGVTNDLERKLEENVLPILKSQFVDGGIKYVSTSFVSLEKSKFDAENLKGTDFLIADGHSAGNMFTNKQKTEFEEKLKSSVNFEETVLYHRTIASNISSVPRYAWFKTLRPGSWWSAGIEYFFNRETGFSFYDDKRIFCVSKLDGKPLQDEEIAVLIQPGQKIVFEFYLPHQPISKERADELSKQSFDIRYIESKKFWHDRLAKAANVQLPEERITNMIKAGLLHIEQNTYGKEPNGTLTPTIGIYSPIGTESAPIIQFYNSMGMHDEARRSLMFFLDKQHDDGLMQNFGGYMVETGAVLWSIGEYFRYTKDADWIRSIQSKLLKSCDFLLNWRNRNKKPELKGKGFGMIDGKVADPEDHFHQYMLNAYAYIGIKRIAEVLENIAPEESQRLLKEAHEWREDIRESLFQNMANSPVVPLGDGTWVSTVPPWTELIGLRALHIIPETFFSHGTVTVSDVPLGPLYLTFCEVLDPQDPASKMMLHYTSELFLQNNSAFSQPYYSRHNWLQLQLGLVKPFLKTYYNTFSALADRNTYTFWEHVYKLTANKTHEEGWFLMETRWMLYREDGERLILLSGIPRKWMEDGKAIELDNVASYFGPMSLKITSNLKEKYIEASIICNSEYKPNEVSIRIPHPQYKKAIQINGGNYDEENEIITISNFTGEATIKVLFPD